MGLTPFARVYLRKTYVQAFSFDMPKDPSVIVYDLMKDLKFMPEEIINLDQAICYITGKIQRLFQMRNSLIHTVVVLVDRKPPPVKRMVTHTGRYKGKNVMSAKEGPYLPVKLTDLIPTPWIRFAGNYRNLQREFYPRLLNAFLDGIHINLSPGQTLILHGFPGYTEWQTTFSKDAYMHGSDERGRVEIVHTWKESTELPITKAMEKEDADLYNRIFFLKHHPASAQHPSGWLERAHWAEAKNEISESDGAMFFYDHWFQHEHIMFICNDGDVFAYGLLYGSERVTPTNTFRNKHYVCMPYKSKQGLDLFEEGKAPKYEYLDLNMLYICVKEDAAFKRAQVQNHIATMAFLLIIAGSDFFKNYMKGLGAEKMLWGTFFSRMSLFSHMVQLSKGLTPHTRTPRTIVLDEERFILFCHYCYLQRFGKAARKKAKREEDDEQLEYEELRKVCNNSGRAKKDPEYELPSQNQIRLWARQILWNLLYYKNTPFGNEHSPSPFEMWQGLPFYPYMLNPETGKPEMVNVVAAYTKPVDEVFSVHMYTRKRHCVTETNSAETEQRKRKTIEALSE
jgi:hypothetical protein